MKARTTRMTAVALALVSSVSLFFSNVEPVRAQPLPTRDDQVRFEKKTVRLGTQTIAVEIADTDQRRQRGLMFRESLPDNQGMLFIFGTEQRLSFWMANTLIPLSIGYFDERKKLVDVQEMVPAVAGERFPRTYPSKAPAMYAIEMPKEWYKRHNVKIGDTFSIIEKR